MYSDCRFLQPCLSRGLDKFSSRSMPCFAPPVALVQHAAELLHTCFCSWKGRVTGYQSLCQRHAKRPSTVLALWIAADLGATGCRLALAKYQELCEGTRTAFTSLAAELGRPVLRVKGVYLEIDMEPWKLKKFSRSGGGGGRGIGADRGGSQPTRCQRAARRHPLRENRQVP